MSIESAAQSPKVLKLIVRELGDPKTAKVCREIDVAGKSERQVERITAGLLINMDTDRYCVDEVVEKAAKPKPLTLDAIAARISAHLKRFASDPIINAATGSPAMSPYYYPSACRHSQWIRISYINFQTGSAPLTKDEAAYYLKRLDEGFVGEHFQALRERDPKWRGHDAARVDGRMRCRTCRRWMRYKPTKLSPAKRRQPPNAATCTDCPVPKKRRFR